MTDGVEKAPALGISVRAAIGDAELVFQTHVDAVATKADLDTLVDRLMAVAARQKAKAELPQLRTALKREEDTLVRMREDRARVEAQLAVPQDGRRAPNRAADQTLAKQRADADVNEKRMAGMIADARDLIAAAEATIAGT